MQYEVYCSSGFCYYKIPPAVFETEAAARDFMETAGCPMCGMSRFVIVVDEDDDDAS